MGEGAGAKVTIAATALFPLATALAVASEQTFPLPRTAVKCGWTFDVRVATVLQTRPNNGVHTTALEQGEIAKCRDFAMSRVR